MICCLHASIVLLLACFHAGFCCLHASIVLLPACFHDTVLMLPLIYCMHTCCRNYASANCMLAYMLLHRSICIFGALFFIIISTDFTVYISLVICLCSFCVSCFPLHGWPLYLLLLVGHTCLWQRLIKE